jgi:Fe-S oxidoreductase
MATYKAEALYQKHDVLGNRRPRGHYVLGRLPQWAVLAARASAVANKALQISSCARLVKALAGIDSRRSIPPLAPRPLRRLLPDAEGVPDVWIWADSFTQHFAPSNALAAIRYLESVGVRAHVITEAACCGLTWMSTGQLKQAREIMARTVGILTPYIDSGVPVIGLEPSCLATLRSDVAELTGSRLDVLTLAEFVEQRGLPVPDLAGKRVVAQPHCHHASVLGWDADRRLLERARATVVQIAGCCGMAGNFGLEKGHYEVSVAVAETHLLPQVRANPDAILLADGISCRVQLDDLAGASSVHLAELLARGQTDE